MSLKIKEARVCVWESGESYILHVRAFARDKREGEKERERATEREKRKFGKRVMKGSSPELRVCNINDDDGVARRSGF